MDIHKQELSALQRAINKTRPAGDNFSGKFPLNGDAVRGRKLFLSLLLVAGIALTVCLVVKSSVIPNQEDMPIVKSVNIKKVAIVIAYRDFRDEEYFIPKRILEKAGIRVVTVSNKEGTAVGSDGGEALVGFSLSSLNVADYDAVIFVGGPGAIKYLDIPESHRIAKEAVNSSKVLGAICVAPVVLANSGVLEGKKTTVWSGPMDKTAVNVIKAGGADFVDKPVVVDELIITGNGPDASEEFAREIIKLIIKASDSK